MTPSYIGALDIGGTKLAACIANADGLLLRLTQPTPKTGAERAIPEQAAALLHAVCRQAGVTPAAIRHVGVASCGPFLRTGGGLAVVAPNLCGGSGARGVPNDWQSIPLEQVLCEQFDTVAIENDCTAALIAERTFGALQGERDCAYVTWSTGIGFGLCVDGQVLSGKHGNAGHAGHMLITEDSDAPCGCGNLGDLEALAGGHNLELRCGKPVRELFAGAAGGDAADLALSTQAARRLGRALYNLVATLDLRRIAVGGSIWSHHADWLAPLVQGEIDRRFPLLTQGVSVQSAALGALVADIGALCLVLPPEWVEPWRRAQAWRALPA